MTLYDQMRLNIHEGIWLDGNVWAKYDSLWNLYDTLWSDEITYKWRPLIRCYTQTLTVCRYLSCNAAEDELMTSAASFNALAAFCSPSAAITCIINITELLWLIFKSHTSYLPQLWSLIPKPLALTHSKVSMTNTNYWSIILQWLRCYSLKKLHVQGGKLNVK